MTEAEKIRQEIRELNEPTTMTYRMTLPKHPQFADMHTPWGRVPSLYNPYKKSYENGRQ